MWIIDVMRNAPGDLGWGSRGKVARRAGVDEMGEATPAGDDMCRFRAVILAEPTIDVFSKRRQVFEFARPT